MKIIIFCTLLVSSFYAQASMLFDPWFGTIVGSKTELAVSGEEEAMGGTSYGFRLGFQGDNLNGGLDWTALTPTIDNALFETYAMSSYGLFLGYRANRLRFTGTYIMGGVVAAIGTEDIGSGVIADALLGALSGFKLGVGFHIFESLTVNFDYMSHTYSSVVTSFSGAVTLDTDQDDLSESIMVVSLSAPFTFF